MLKSPWATAAIVFVVLCLLVWLFVKLGKRMMEWAHEPVEPGKPRWTYALTPIAAALAPLAAFSALLPSYLNQQQGDRKFMAEAERNRTDSTWQRYRLDTQTLSAEFSQVQTRFGSSDAKTRAVAALQLADLACAAKPSASDEAATDENYPYFRSTGLQLAVALQMEQNAEVCAAVGEAIQKLSAFAGEKKNGAWQIALANHLANTNRRVKAAFIQSVARHTAAFGPATPPTLTALATIAPFSEPNTTALLLQEIMVTADFRAHRQVAVRLRNAQTSESRRAGDASRLAQVQEAAFHLTDTRDALAGVLRGLKDSPPTAPRALPSLPDLPSLPSPTDPSPAKTDAPGLDLRNCFLVGADLRGAGLKNADFAGANLNGARLHGADLSTANVETALRVPPSVARANFGGNQARRDLLARKFPQYDWAGSQPKPK